MVHMESGQIWTDLYSKPSVKKLYLQRKTYHPGSMKKATPYGLGIYSGVVSVSCFGVRVSVMFHFMFVHYTFSSVWVAEWPPFGK